MKRVKLYFHNVLVQTLYTDIEGIYTAPPSLTLLHISLYKCIDYVYTVYSIQYTVYSILYTVQVYILFSWGVASLLEGKVCV